MQGLLLEADGSMATKHIIITDSDFASLMTSYTVYERVSLKYVYSIGHYMVNIFEN